MAEHKTLNAGIAVVRFDEQGRPVMLNKRDHGWGEYGFPYPDWKTLVERWNVTVTGVGCDEHGPYIQIAPLAGEQSAR